MDCGESTQRKFSEHGIGFNKEMMILITHLHGDHVNGLLGLLQTMSMSQRIKILTIIAPSALLNWLKMTIDLLYIVLSFEIKFIVARTGIVYKGKEYRIVASRAHHSIESYAYVFQELPRPGIFDPEKAVSLGITKGEKWSRLQHGKEVVINGKKFRSSDVMGPKRAGRNIGYSGDTRPTKRLAKFFSDNDLLIFDSTFSFKDIDKALERKHSTALEAARLANEAKVKRLVLTHFSARYKRVSHLLREAKAIFPNTIVAKDGLTIEVPYPT
jgi:ribonuclease Z